LAQRDRPKKKPQEAIQRVSDAIIQEKTYVIDLDLQSHPGNVGFPRVE
jgi:hypothetical protein